LPSEEQEKIRQALRDYQQAYYYANQEEILRKKKEYYYENRDLILVNKAQYYIDNKEARVAYNREYYAKNAIELNEKGRKYYEENHEKCLETARLYRLNNPEKVKACEKACDANRRGAPGKITSADVQDALEASEGRCPYCICELVFGKIHIDHVIPLARGGHNIRENIVACCEECNLRKHDKTPREFVLGLRYEF
jgi:5-methylcytosine-specific restriction endonuclease McrA